jgi:hypothetical protein
MAKAHVDIDEQLDRHGTWRQTIARAALPRVVAAAQQQQLITYGALRDWIAQNTDLKPAIPHNYGHPAGIIGNVCIGWAQERGKPVPPLNAIIVSKAKGRPSSGADYYLNWFQKQKSLKLPHIADGSRKERIVEAIIKEVHTYRDWDGLLERCDLSALPQATVITSGKGKRTRGINPPNGGGEGEKHKALKDWVVANGPRLPFGVSGKGVPEYLFPSGDRGDVFFAKDWTIIEVKADNVPDLEIERGIWQTRKYQLLLDEVMKYDGLIPVAKALSCD